MKDKKSAGLCLSSSSSYSCWSSLPNGILDNILDRLVSISDYIRFSTVCLGWRGVALDERNDRSKTNSRITSFNQHHQLPMLMNIPNRTFHSLPNFQEVKVNSYFPDGNDKCIIGSSFGWLIYCDENYDISLYNPFSSKYRNRPIHLPRFGARRSFLDFGLCSITKAVLSAPPDSASGYVIAVIYSTSYKFAFLQVKNNQENKQLVWNYPCKEMVDYELEDLIFDEDGELLVLDCRARVLSCNFNDPLPVVNIKFEPPFPKLCFCHENFGFADYLRIVKSTGGDLLLVKCFDRRSMSLNVYKLSLNLYKLDLSGPRWIEMDNLGNDILFLGPQYNAANSISVSQFDFPSCTPACVYITEIHQPLYVRSEEGSTSTDDKQDKCFMKTFDIASDIEDRLIWVVPTL